MRVHSFSSVFTAFLLILSALILGSSCASNKVGDEDDEAAPGIGRLNVKAPEKGRWKRLVSRADCRFLYSPDDKFDDDVVVLYVRALATPKELGGEDALLAWLDESDDKSMIDSYVDDVLGRAVVRVERYILDTAGNPEEVLQALRLRRREEGDYWIRSKSILVDDPEVSGQALEIGVARNSYHGIIGEHYLGIGRDFTETVLLENDLAGFDAELLDLP